MSTSWSELLKNQSNDAVSSKRISIICTPSVETLRAFEKNYLPTGCRLSNQSMHSIGFVSICLRDDFTRNESIECELYSVPFPLRERSLRYLECLVDVKSSEVKWWFILDWKLPNQKYWLRELIQSHEMVKAANPNLAGGSIIINCMHTDQIYVKQKITTDWHSTHVEFLQQTLRSFSFAKECSLIYSDPNHDTKTSGIQLLGQLLTDNYKEIQADFVSETRLLIPYGCDTPGLIKTLNESFEPLQVLEEDFITQKFEKFIPGTKLVLDDDEEEQEEQEANGDADCDTNRPYTVDIEQELSQLYNWSKQQFTMKKI